MWVRERGRGGRERGFYVGHAETMDESCLRVFHDVMVCVCVYAVVMVICLTGFTFAILRPWTKPVSLCVLLSW